ncbi:MarR family transcriptional regulator [Nonomuraea phyllanthi]|uniref:MarR family winged helix-turn-helix transcriptional regulator n=1 Tax=Nonomuraea phyllanthi TaxID=2219224 RepID=UPI001292EB2D|nr:MarR family winged helix-turn-helix transcriptional regulator [Nonomuraea phyllanthi]QFY10404.1 MarR family transcriptional regulator [Nonomuraea phyllanthi]
MFPDAPRTDELRLAIGLARVRSMMRLLEAPRDLSMTTLSTLATLERQGPRRLTELAAIEGVTQPAMTRLVSRLEHERLAERLPDPVDGRVVVVAITQHGRDELARRRAAQAKRLAELLADLSEADRQAIAAALPAIDRLTTHAFDSLTSPAPTSPAPSREGTTPTPGAPA